MSNAVAPAPVSAFNLFGFSDDQFEKAIPSISDNAPLLCFVGAIYVPVQFFLRDVMVKHERFGLRWFAIPWNALLATFSFLGAIHTLPQAVESLYTRGFTASMCDVGFYHTNTAYWVFLFNCSKGFEFVDTVILRLKKAPVPLLHWYHHIVTFLFCWWGNVHVMTDVGTGWYFASINLGVHAIMYSYFGLTALSPAVKEKLVSWGVDKMITKIQIAQMVFGLMALVGARDCQSPGRDWVAWYSAIVMYGSYFALFGWLYIQKYQWKQAKKAQEKREQAKKAATNATVTDKGVESPVNATNGTVRERKNAGKVSK